MDSKIRSIVADPDNRQLYEEYAVELGDEHLQAQLIQLQWILEDQDLEESKRLRIESRERSVLEEAEPIVLGELAEELMSKELCPASGNSVPQRVASHDESRCEAAQHLSGRCRPAGVL